MFVGAFDHQCHWHHLPKGGENFFGAEAYCSPEHTACDTVWGVFTPYDCNGNITACREDSPNRYPNFDSFGNSFMTLYRVGTFDHFGDALWHTQNAKGATVVLMYTVFVVVGPCIVSNVCIAALIKNFSDAQEEAIKEVRRGVGWG